MLTESLLLQKENFGGRQKLRLGGNAGFRNVGFGLGGESAVLLQWTDSRSRRQ